MDAIPVLAFVPGTGSSISATATSGSVTITADTAYDKMHVVNTHATIYAAVRLTVGASTAVIGTDICVPPQGQIIIAMNPLIDTISAVASASTAVIRFQPLLRGA